MSHIIGVSVRMLFVLTFVCGLIYPLAVTGISQVLFPRQANGSMVYDREGDPVGSALLGQGFQGSQYFHPRPSAAGDDGYDATSSAGTNLGPTSGKLLNSVKDQAKTFRQDNGLPAAEEVPADAVTSSASGLDPHISLESAFLQVQRVAQARNMKEEEVMKLVNQYAEGRTLGFLGEPRVNVLRLNMALDGVQTGS